MKNLRTLTLFVLPTLTLAACGGAPDYVHELDADDPQCNMTVPADFFVVTDGTQDVEGEDDLYICPGVSMTLEDESLTIFAGTGVDLMISGDTLDLYVEGSSDITVSGNNATIFTEDYNDVTIDGAVPDIYVCPTLTLNTADLNESCD
jgi:hypothetical protein